MEREVEELLRRAGLNLLWFDSMGAKSSSIFLEDGVLIDPGAAAMQPSYPLEAGLKEELRREAIRLIEHYSWASRLIVITHYHHDHYTSPLDKALSEPASIYRGAELLAAKNPNLFINHSQWERARRFVDELAEAMGEEPPPRVECREACIGDPVEELVESHRRDWGDYAARRAELLGKGRRWFMGLVEEWMRGPCLPERLRIGGLNIVFDDNFCYTIASTRLCMMGPFFHGIEYDRTGWVTPVYIEARGVRILYTSDLMGPMIEDYAYWIASLKPEVIIADGPPTYLYPYMLNRINLERALECMEIILLETEALKLVVYDHHLMRDRRWRRRVAPVLQLAEKLGVIVAAASEVKFSSPPLIDVITKG
ncbi:MAG: MBL fold metallo-hydrolase [Crenarchaeota archaeon]|nr:MBL fold metallo-hydrolase [Thermoproteota archaeon]